MVVKAVRGDIICRYVAGLGVFSRDTIYCFPIEDVSRLSLTN